MVSIALCTYNGEKYIEEQLESLINQTYQPDEIIICDDQSKDNTVNKAKSLLCGWPGIWKIVINKKNLGYKKNFQKAISLCRGDIIFLSDQDDVWDSNKLNIILDAFQKHPKAMMIFHDAEIVNENLQRIYPSLWKNMGFDCQEFMNNMYGRFIEGNVVQGAACAFRKKLFQTSQPFPIEAIHDEWLALNAIPNGGIYPVNRKLLKYRQTGSNEIGAVAETVMGKLQKWIKNTKIRLHMHNEELIRYVAVWSVLAEKYGDALVLGNETASTFFLFLNHRKIAISRKQVSKLPLLCQYFSIYRNKKIAIWTKVKDMLAIFL
ncbi:glycosyltransferase family 2 protein [uncultured Megasphaera sp.]|uniref:glycosyltransferase family 2 protein n=1 Tax=uncultured Megasphaera sp. TaxID=165188 RepID=UPI0025E5E9AF|nr:glycosyltransferase family 2 protein [uncultured Megasphaera sp.]